MKRTTGNTLASKEQPRLTDPSVLGDISAAGETLRAEIGQVGTGEHATNALLVSIYDLAPDVEDVDGFAGLMGAFTEKGGEEGIQARQFMDANGEPFVGVALFGVQSYEDAVTLFADYQKGLAKKAKKEGLDRDPDLPDELQFMPANLIAVLTELRKAATNEFLALDKELKRAAELGAMAVDSTSTR